MLIKENLKNKKNQHSAFITCNGSKKYIHSELRTLKH